MPRKLFEIGNPGKPKGAISKKCAFENFLFDNFIANQDKAETLLNKMYLDKHEFKWVMGLLNSRMPSETSSINENINTDKRIIIEIDKSGDREPQTKRVSEEVLQKPS